MRLTFIPPSSAPAVLSARWIMVSPEQIKENHCLETARGRVVALAGKPLAGKVRDLGPGLIMPLLVNAHTHLELSALKGQVDWSLGFETWVSRLIARRQALTAADLTLAAAAQAQAQHGMGTGALAEISTLGLTRQVMERVGLMGVWFREVLGNALDPAVPAGIWPESFDTMQPVACAVSLAGHGPHTTSPEVLRQLAAITSAKGQPFSIHLAESDAEKRFIQGDNPAWADFLVSRGIETRSWPVGGKSPVQYAFDIGILGPKTLAVHLLETLPGDLALLARTRTRICLCPRSNFNLHQRLPDIQAILNQGLAPALGTDSLASCDSLSLFDEMAFVRSRYPGLSPKTVLAMAGVNGAHALGLGAFLGHLNKGCWAGCLYVELLADSSDEILERLSLNDF